MQELTLFISQHATLSIAAAIVFLLLMIVEGLRARKRTLTATPAEVTQRINRDNAVVIDIRPIDHYRQGHIIDAQSFAIEDFNHEKKLEKFKNRPLIIVCNSGLEAQKIAARLVKQGYNACSLAGGMRAWSSADMPLVKG